MFGRNDRSGLKLYDLESDPDMNHDVAGDNPEIVKRMFEDYILEDAGGSLPRIRAPEEPGTLRPDQNLYNLRP